MKKTLLIAALTMVSASAFASKARLDALQNAAHLSDIQNSFEKPYEAANHGELATFEFGPTGSATTRGEGGFFRQMGEGSYLGFYLGRASSDFVSSLGDFETAATLTAGSVSGALVSNPFNVLYASKSGDMTWGLNFAYMNSDKKTPFNVDGTAAADVTGKANVMGISLGATNGVWDASFAMGLAGKATLTAVATNNLGLATDATAEMNSKSNMKIRGGYKMDNMYYHAHYKMTAGTGTVAGTEVSNKEGTDMALGFINSLKRDGADFFYGASYVMTSSKEKTGAGSKTETTNLPVIIGVEAEAANWLVFRASITQSVLLGSTKTTETDTLAANNNVAAGVGMKWNKFMFDGTLAAAQNATGAFGLDSAGFMAKSSFTYLF